MTNNHNLSHIFFKLRNAIYNNGVRTQPPTIHTESMHVKLCNICKTAHVLAKECFL
jgi:hypothetical protein